MPLEPVSLGPVQPDGVRVRTSGWIVALDLGAKLLLVVSIALITVDPSWGNLEGKAPGTRALTYPLLAFLVPVVHLWRHPGRRFPWGVDLLVTAPAFSDILGNRLDLYDQVTWFDDFIHLANTGALSAAAVIACGANRAPLLRRLELSIAIGLTLALVWEVWEYLAFVTRSAEVGTAYADTVLDLALGWLGAAVAAVLLGIHRSTPSDRPSPSQAHDDAPRDRRTHVRWG